MLPQDYHDDDPADLEPTAEEGGPPLDLFGRPLDDESDYESADEEPLDEEPLDDENGSWWGEDEGEDETAGAPTRRAVLYLRVSSEKQRKGGGLVAQREKLEALCKAHDIHVVEAVEEIASTSLDFRAREGGRRCMQLLKSGEVDTVAVLRLDRWCRSATEAHSLLAWLKRKGWELVMADPYIDTTSAVGELTLSILAAFAQLERYHIRQRTKDAMRARHRKQRLPIGHIRFGERLECGNCGVDYRSDPSLPRRCLKCIPSRGGGMINLKPHPEQLATLGMIANWDEANMSMQKIAWELEESRRKTKRGHTKWNKGTVHRLVMKLRKSSRLREKARDALHKAKLEA